MEENPNQERVRQRLEQERDEAARERERQMAARVLENERVIAEIPLVCQMIVVELNRLDWPDAILQDNTVLHALDHSSAVAMNGEIYMLPYRGDGEYDTRWRRFTRLETLAPPSFFLGILEAKLAELRSR